MPFYNIADRLVRHGVAESDDGDFGQSLAFQPAGNVGQSGFLSV